MANISCLIFLLLLLAASSESSNTTEAVDLQLPRFIEETFPYLTSDATNLFPPPPKLTSQATASTEESFVTPHPDSEDVTAYPEADTFEELIQDFGDIVEGDVWEEKDDVDIEGAESREASIYRIAKQKQMQEYEEYDYEAGYEVDIAEPRSSSYGAPEETYGAPQETYGSPHEEPYGSYDSGHKIQPKKPGPFGYETPNFKCEKASETLYVTETEWTFDKKCYTVYKVQCSDGYDTGKGIGYQKHCNEFTVTRCRTVFDTSSEERCWTVYKKKCEMVYETVVDWEYEQKCTTSYEEECHGYGYHQECEKVPKEHCKQVPKKVEKQVPRTKCRKVPDKRCQDFPINVPRKECKEFPKTVCTQDPVNVAKKIPKKTCVQIPREVCNKIPRQIIKEVPKKVGKKVCTSTKATSSYGEEASSYQAPPSYTAPADDYGAPVSSSYGAPVSSGYGAPSHSAHRRSSQHSPQRKQQSELAPADNWGRGPG